MVHMAALQQANLVPSRLQRFQSLCQTASVQAPRGIFFHNHLSFDTEIAEI